MSKKRRKERNKNGSNLSSTGSKRAAGMNYSSTWWIGLQIKMLSGSLTVKWALHTVTLFFSLPSDWGRQHTLFIMTQRHHAINVMCCFIIAEPKCVTITMVICVPAVFKLIKRNGDHSMRCCFWECFSRNVRSQLLLYHMSAFHAPGPKRVFSAALQLAANDSAS